MSNTTKITVEIPTSVVDDLDTIVNRFDNDEITRNNIVSYALQMLVVNEYPELIPTDD